MKKEIWGIILAAGFSRRMGRSKLALPYQEKPIVRHVIDKALRSNLDGVLVVINPLEVEFFKTIQVTGVKSFIVNEETHLGMATSIKKGLRALPQDVEAVVILLGDQPKVTETSINQVLETYLQANQPLIVQSLYLNHEKGHPVLFKRDVFPSLFEMNGDTGGKSVIQQFRDEIVYAEIKESNSKDIDTVEDYERLMNEKEV
ncbi:nucleotidyltransferase family protein [Halalkalibacterium ligniniphilum]|uniref:nucleotidyltransferase family protein n=1 Tax=Halalkalibacterium ligniniphilum TaxID=1134413 RepID=UPI00035EE38F|nr:nucleotidyltransferase family protein [Halalkalibacterium ligniniphilum]